MAYQQKEGDIAIFVVKEKKTGNGPDWTGKALIDGKEKDISLWIKSETMMTGKVKPKWEPDFKKVKNDIEKSAIRKHNEPLEDEIPF